MIHFFSFNEYLLTSVDTILGDLAVNKRNKSSSLGILPSRGGGRGFNVTMLKNEEVRQEGISEISRWVLKFEIGQTIREV